MEKGREGGMWLGVSLNKSNSSKFKFGALLNLTGEERKHGVIGRGPIVADYLKTEITAKDYLENLRNGEQHNAFNFVAVELRLIIIFYSFASCYQFFLVTQQQKYTIIVMYQLQAQYLKAHKY